jgi:hypothetical protein
MLDSYYTESWSLLDCVTTRFAQQVLRDLQYIGLREEQGRFTSISNDHLGMPLIVYNTASAQLDEHGSSLLVQTSHLPACWVGGLSATR